jgi:hypothetical protein
MLYGVGKRVHERFNRALYFSFHEGHHGWMGSARRKFLLLCHEGPDGRLIKEIMAELLVGSAFLDAY